MIDGENILIFYHTTNTPSMPLIITKPKSKTPQL